MTAHNYGIPLSPKKASIHGTDQSFLWVHLEDFEDGKPMDKHFFGHDYVKGRGPRFMLWDGGGGIGHEATEEEANSRLRNYAREQLELRIARMEAELLVTKRSLQVLTTTGLGEFEVPEEWTPLKANGKQAS